MLNVRVKLIHIQRNVINASNIFNKTSLKIEINNENYFIKNYSNLNVKSLNSNTLSSYQNFFKIHIILIL